MALSKDKNSFYAIRQYYTEVEKIIRFGGTKKETAVRNAFYNLLNTYASQRGLVVVAEVSVKTHEGKTITPDGTLKDSLRQDWGYWESKDEADNLDEEIEKKFAKGYPRENILFEDSKTVILIQNGEEVMRVSVECTETLDSLLTKFISFERQEVQDFRKAIDLFRQDIPKVTDTIRAIIIDAENTNHDFNSFAADFLELCRDSINPQVTVEDVREMMIQHILTEDIFNTIFGETQFHRENNIARELEKVIKSFFTGAIRKTVLGSIRHYYDAINAAASSIADHHEKQKFLKVIYETFYKSYNPEAADRLGVVYTPNEIVRFMIESTDYLLSKHFGRYLEDINVEILDPATGTGTFICDMIDYIRADKLEHKYKNEMHANEVAILPYYISNLNIEFTYTQKMSKYAEFKNLCFVDTLDNTETRYKGQGHMNFVSEENSGRIKNQNRRKIAVIIGNPPYNANQANENDNNKNREYPHIDERIKETFIKYSTAQKTKVYDMYARFYRWAFDRLDSNGIVAFVTNRSFINSRTFDGFRKTVQQEFEAAYIIDTRSDVRVNPKIAGTTHNVFGIQTGVAIMFLVKKQNRENKTCKIHYITLDDFWRKEQKLQWLSENHLRELIDRFEIIRPDKHNNWINLADNDFDSLLSLCSKNAKFGRGNETLFELFSLGVNTARDEWVFDLSKENLTSKISYFVGRYNKQLNSDKKDNASLDYTIKWSEALKTHLNRKDKLIFNEKNIIRYLYRPFHQKFYYSDKKLSDRLTSNHTAIFGKKLMDENWVIAFSGISNSKPFSILISDKLFDLHLNGDAQCLPLYRYDANGNRIDNITDWGLEQFIKHYEDENITKQDIFHYVYAVLHSPAYRKKYELNLKREFPRIPFYDDFYQWAEWGRQLMDLHLNYEKVEQYPLQLVTINDKTLPKPKLKADKESSMIILDENSIIKDIPAEVWDYKLGNRSALEWILDQYQEKKPKDATIAEKFNTYRFADYKEQVVELLKRVCTVSIETVKIVSAMQKAE
ncbi:MAG: N-6 DNA methylase [Campylobacteraceae bacterium]|jgi:predicted helicase|nr:N-6 DNA methylase [Campylobacteraceae bacterium]